MIKRRKARKQTAKEVRTEQSTHILRCGVCGHCPTELSESVVEFTCSRCILAWTPLEVKQKSEKLK
jgi:hypothetical protein